MPQYKYELTRQDGSSATGLLDAPDIRTASNKLMRKGGRISALAPVPGGENSQTALQKIMNFSIESAPGLKDVLTFTTQLSVMIKAGVNIRSAIGSVGEQLENGRFKKIVLQIKSDVESGKAFSDALARHPKTFSALYVNMIRASEMSGSLGDMLNRVADYQAQQMETRRMVRGAMVYPIIIAIMAVVTTVFMLTFVMPRFMHVFKGKEAILPKPTKALLAASDFMQLYWMWAILALAALLGGFIWFVRTDYGKVWWDKFKLKLPIFKKMLSAMYISRGLKTMGELVNAGVPMLETIAITSDVSGNTLYSRMWREVHDSVQQGKKISDTLGGSKLLPGNVVQMISAGEESGKLAEVLADVSEYYESELKSAIKVATSMIEPVMIVLMGFVVGFIAMSVILPIFKMSSLTKG